MPGTAESGWLRRYHRRSSTRRAAVFRATVSEQRLKPRRAAKSLGCPVPRESNRAGCDVASRRRRVGKIPALRRLIVPVAALVLLIAIVAPACGAASSAPGAATPEPTAAPAPNPDREALAALYHATDGPNWKRNSNWLSEAPLGRWNLVHTNPRGRVTVLALQENQMRGEIPPQLGDMEDLLILSLDGNELHGEIPPELGRLVNLDTLMLGDNQLSGEIPAELGRLTNLVSLRLNNNQLTGEIPPELADLPKLSMLMLGGNQLTGCIPDGLGKLMMHDFGELGLPFCGTTEGPQALEPTAVSRTGLPAVGDTLGTNDGLEVTLVSVQRLEQLTQANGSPVRPKNGRFLVVTISYSNTHGSGSIVAYSANMWLIETDGNRTYVDSEGVNALVGMATPATEGRPLLEAESVPIGQTATFAIVFDVDPGLVDLQIDIEGLHFEVPNP